MLKGEALSYYYNHKLSSNGFDSVCTNLRNFFEGENYYRNNLIEWNTITLSSIIDKNPGSSLVESVRTLLESLTSKQFSLDPAFRGDIYL